MYLHVEKYNAREVRLQAHAASVGVRIMCAPRRFIAFTFSPLIFFGMQMITLYPSTAPAMQMPTSTVEVG